MMSRSIVLALVVVLGCSDLPDEDVGDTQDDLLRNTGVLCRSDLASCHEMIVADVTTRAGARPCEQDAGSHERCVAGVMWAYAIIMNDAGTRGVASGGCKLFFRLEERFVPVEAFIPNNDQPTAGMHVRLTDEFYVVHFTEGFDDVVLEGCEGTEAAAVVSEGYVDEVIYAFDVEPSDVFYDRPWQPDGERETGPEQVVPYPLFNGSIELRAGDASLRIPMQSLWMPWADAGGVHELSGEAWVWDILSTGWTPRVRNP